MEVSKVNGNTGFTAGISARLYKNVAKDYIDRPVIEVAKKIDSILPKKAQIVAGVYDDFNKSTTFLLDRADIPTGKTVSFVSKGGNNLREALMNIEEKPLREAGKAFDSIV